MKKFFLIIMVNLMAVALFAQNDEDAYRFSQTNNEGTARFMGAGGSFGAVGAEFSGLNINPAGIAIFKKNEVSFTPTVISVINNQTKYGGESRNFCKINYSLSNAGVEFKLPLNNQQWKSLHFGFGYNRIMDFNNAYRIEGISDHSSKMDQILAESNGTDYSKLQLDNDLAFQTYMIDLVDSAIHDLYYSPFAKQSLKQNCLVKTGGAIDEMIFTFGGNYGDKLFVGATVGVPFVNFRQDITYSESVLDEPLEDRESYTTDESLRITASGINLKLGVIYQPVEFFRVGIAFHTPTYYNNVKDHLEKEMISYYGSGRNSGVFSYTNDFNYTLITPLKAIGSVAFLINKRAFVSLEYEFTDYSMSKMYSNIYSFSTENQEIIDNYGGCHKARIGAEVYATKHLLVRAGYAFKSNGYRNGINNDASHTFSLGLGYRSQFFFIDFAYLCRLYKEDIYLYDKEYVAASNIKNDVHKIVATLGFKF